MTFSQVLFKQQKLLALQAVLFSVLMSTVMVISAVVYSKTTLYDQNKDSGKKGLREQKAFEKMFTRP